METVTMNTRGLMILSDAAKYLVLGMTDEGMEVADVVHAHSAVLAILTIVRNETKLGPEFAGGEYLRCWKCGLPNARHPNFVLAEFMNTEPFCNRCMALALQALGKGDRLESLITGDLGIDLVVVDSNVDVIATLIRDHFRSGK